MFSFLFQGLRLPDKHCVILKTKFLVFADLNKNVLKEHTKLFASVFTEAQKKIKKVWTIFQFHLRTPRVEEHYSFSCRSLVFKGLKTLSRQ